MTDYRGGRSYVRDLAGNIVKAFTEVDPPGGGAITVTDGVTTVEGVTSLEVSGLSVAADGEGVAQLEGAAARVYYGEEDPGAVGAGAIWVRPTDVSGTIVPALFMRNEGDDAWQVPSFLEETSTLVVLRGLWEITGPPGQTVGVIGGLDGGNVQVKAGNGIGGPNGGSVEIVGGSQLSPSGGEPGGIGVTGSEGGEPGAVYIQGSGRLILLNLPTADPEVAGQVYSAGAPGPADPKALMVSGGPAA